MDRYQLNKNGVRLGYFNGARSVTMQKWSHGKISNRKTSPTPWMWLMPAKPSRLASRKPNRFSVCTNSRCARNRQFSCRRPFGKSHPKFRRYVGKVQTCQRFAGKHLYFRRYRKPVRTNLFSRFLCFSI